MALHANSRARFLHFSKCQFIVIEKHLRRYICHTLWSRQRSQKETVVNTTSIQGRSRKFTQAFLPSHHNVLGQEAVIIKSKFHYCKCDLTPKLLDTDSTDTNAWHWSQLCSWSISRNFLKSESVWSSSNANPKAEFGWNDGIRIFSIFICWQVSRMWRNAGTTDNFINQLLWSLSLESALIMGTRAALKILG